VAAYRLSQLAEPTGGITEKREVRRCRYRCGASCFNKLFCRRSGDTVGEALGHTLFGACSLLIVNQVLVRLWARCGRKSDRMWSVSREFLVGDGSSRGRGNVFRGVCCVLSQDDPVRDRSWARRLVFGLGRPHKGLLITDH
jgi:hypothetical protein